MSGSEWILYNTTIDDPIEYERCLEELYTAGLRSRVMRYLVLRCSICPLAEGAATY